MNINRNRFIIFGVVFFGLFAVLFVQLAKLTLVKGADFRDKSEKLRDEKITISGARGSILDRNGLPLAYDHKSYNVQIYRDPLKNTVADKANYTRIIMETIDIVEKNGGKTVDTFAIQHDKNTGAFYFDWGKITKSAKAEREKNWRKNMYISIEKNEDEQVKTTQNAEETESTAQATEKPVDGTQGDSEGEDKASVNVSDYSVTPEEIYLTLRERYQIPAEMDYEEARKILSIWQDVQLASWRAFEPVTIAYNVNTQTVAEIETHAVELEGMSIAESTTRVYPRGSLAAHIIGYTGRITGDVIDWYSISEDTEKRLTAVKKLMDSKLLGSVVRQGLEDTAVIDYIDGMALSSEKSLKDFGYTEQDLEGIKGLLDLGYSVDGIIGSDGVEKTMEAYLTGDIKKRQGVQEVQVDKRAIVRNVLSTTEPKQGDNVVLTIDVPFQQAVERSLAQNIPEMRQYQLDRYERLKDSKDYKDLDISKVKLADSGAAVVIDVHTGALLAMSSYPSYDLNLFVNGISTEDFENLKNDPAYPLYNKAVSSRGTPGSIFKMVTGLGALMEGATTLTEQIDDEGPYMKYTKDPKTAPKCHTNNISKHQNQTIVEGLQNSCNYYFYTMADRIGIVKLNEWGEKFGLTVSTGIELPGEAIGQVGGQKVLFDPDKPINKQPSSMPRLVVEGETYGIIKIIKDFAKQRELNFDDEEIRTAALELVYLMRIEWRTEGDSVVLRDERGVAMGDHIRSILYKHLNITAPVANSSRLVTDISSMLSQLMWTPTITLYTGIGQGYIQVTPVAVARYVAAIVNGGIVYETHVVDRVIDQSGEVVYEKEPVVYGKLNAPPEYLDKIKEGMSNVVNAEDGTASGYFKDFRYADQIGGKTGTAEVSEIDLENNSWFVCFAPYDEPKIAVVVYVPHGYSGGLSSYIAQDIVEFYLDREAMVAEQTIPAADSLVAEQTIPEDDSSAE